MTRDFQRTRPAWPHRRIIGLGAVIVGYLIATLIMTWPYFNYEDFAGSSYVGDQRLIIWTLAWDNHVLFTSDSFFQSNLFFPAQDSLRYNEHLFGISLFSLPWVFAGASPVLAHNATLWLAFPLNGLATFVLLHRFTRTRTSAFVGSLAFTFSSYVMLHAHAHLHLIWLWPIPLSLVLLERWFDAPTKIRVGAWTTAVLLQILSSWYQAVLVLVANGVFAAHLMLTANSLDPAWSAKGIRTRSWYHRVVQLALAAAVLVICVYPLARRYEGITSTHAEIAGYSADLSSYLVPPQNTMAGRWWRENVNNRPRSIWGESTVFAGWITLTLAVAGFAALLSDPKRDVRAWLFPSLTIVAGLLSCGPALPLIGTTALAPFNLVASIPGLDGFRVPARFAALVMLGLAGLTGIGVAAIERRFGIGGRLLVALVVPVMLLEWFVFDFPAGKPASHTVPAIYLTPQVQTARALVSLPDYRGSEQWFLGGDYAYYSTAHWRPIVNGFGRTEPAGHGQIIDTVRRFPESAPALQTLGIQYVVVHAARFSDHGREILEATRERSDCRLVLQIGTDYLFEIIAAGR